MTFWTNVRAANCGMVRRAMAEMVKNDVWGRLVAVKKSMTSLLVVRLSQTGASRERARERRQRSAASGSSALTVWTTFVRDSVAVGKQELEKKNRAGRFLGVYAAFEPACGR